MKLRLYIVQFLGIFLLTCFYFLDVQADKEYAMHFSVSSSSAYVISKSKQLPVSQTENVNGTSFSKSKPSHKYNIGKHYSYKLIFPQNSFSPPFMALNTVNHTPAIPARYNYLFFQEVNPPPPKCGQAFNFAV